MLLRGRHVVTDDLGGFCGGIRPTFLLLQTAFCSGITRAALTESAARLTGLGAQFAGEHEALAARYESLRERLHRFAADPVTAGSADLIRLRLDGSLVAVAATRLESTLRGGAGYASSSAGPLHFGTGRAATVDRVEIRWPSGALQVLENVAADQVLTVREPA